MRSERLTAADLHGGFQLHRLDLADSGEGHQFFEAALAQKSQAVVDCCA